MSIDQQIDRLKGHVLIFTAEFRDLILGFEMLVPVADNKKLLTKFSRTKRAHGLQIVRGSLIQEYKQLLGLFRNCRDNKRALSY